MSKIFLVITFTGALVNFKNCDIFSVMRKILNQRGFMMLNVVFLTLIASLAAVILMNAATRVRNPQSTLRLTALYVANEQLAQMESLAARSIEPTEEILVEDADLKTTNFSTGEPIRFEVVPEKIGGNTYKVTVSWTVKGQEDSVTVERTIWIVPKEDS